MIEHPPTLSETRLNRPAVLRGTRALSHLVLLYQHQGRRAEAIPLIESALEIEEHLWGPEHPNVAARLATLGLVYRNEGRYEDAAPHLERALYIREQIYRK